MGAFWPGLAVACTCGNIGDICPRSLGVTDQVKAKEVAILAREELLCLVLSPGCLGAAYSDQSY